MQDVIQQTLEAWATHGPVARAAFIFCAAILIYLLAAAWLVVVARTLRRLNVEIVVRVALTGLLAFLASTVLTVVVADPRPYIVTHTRPLIATAHDNGFPSDHVLLAAALTASLWWIGRRWLAAFAVGTLCIMLGRLGVGAHHTLDVLGSVAIAAVVTVAVAVLPLPARWRTPLLPALRRLGMHRDRAA